MALILGSNLVKGSLFDLSDYESAFHPWWDSLQDYIMYTAIIVGESSLFFDAVKMLKRISCKDSFFVVT